LSGKELISNPVKPHETFFLQTPSAHDINTVLAAPFLRAAATGIFGGKSLNRMNTLEGRKSQQKQTVAAISGQ
jgi:hypothetical protein